MPLLFAFIVLVPCLLFSFDAFVVDGLSLLTLPLFATDISDIKKSDMLVITDLKSKDFKLLPLYRLMRSTVLLPLLFAFIVLVPCLLFSFDAFVVDGFSLLTLPLVVNGVTKNTDTTKGNIPLVAYNSRNFSSSIDVSRGAELIKSLLSSAEKLYINIGDNSMLDAINKDLKGLSGGILFYACSIWKIVYRKLSGFIS